MTFRCTLNFDEAPCFIHYNIHVRFRLRIFLVIKIKHWNTSIYAD